MEKHMAKQSFKENLPPQPIHAAMDSDHKRIDRLLEKFEDRYKKNQSHELNSKFFLEFKWALEKHMFIEERAIFTFLKDELGQYTQIVEDILKEHAKIIALLAEAEKELLENNKVDLSRVKNKLEMHASFEDDFFYPRLDEELDIKHKKEIIKRVKQIIKENANSNASP